MPTEVPKPEIDPIRAVTLTVLSDGAERTFQAVPLTITRHDYDDGDGEWVLDFWDVERETPDWVSLKDVAGHVLTAEQAERLVIRFDWRPEGE